MKFTYEQPPEAVLVDEPHVDEESHLEEHLEEEDEPVDVRQDEQLASLSASKDLFLQ